VGSSDAEVGGAGARRRGVGQRATVAMFHASNASNSKKLNKSAQSNEYESCRSNYPLQLLQRL
jgi:hypothetical protein